MAGDIVSATLNVRDPRDPGCGFRAPETALDDPRAKLDASPEPGAGSGSDVEKVRQ